MIISNRRTIFTVLSPERMPTRLDSLEKGELVNKSFNLNRSVTVVLTIFLIAASGGAAQAAPHAAASVARAGAAAAPMPPGSGPSGSTTSTMYVSGFDEKVARAHGYEIVKDAKGKAIGSKKVGAVSSQSIIWDVCGESHVYYYAQGGMYTTATTGYTLYQDPIWFGWDLDVVDDAGVARFSWGGPNWQKSWQEQATSWHSVPGYSYAYLTNGWVMLNDGSICDTGHPSDYAIVY